MKQIAALLACSALTVTASSAQAANSALDLLSRFNVITGNYTANNETEGSAFVYGTYLPNGSSSRFGFNSGQVSNDSQNVLWLYNGVGNSNRTTLITGSVVSRTPVTSSQFTLNGNAPGDPSINSGQTAWNTAMSSLGFSTISDFTNVLTSASTQWSQLPANSVGSIPGNGSFTFNSTPTNIDGRQVAVFNVSAAQLFGGTTFDRLELNANGASTILINVSGTNISVEKNFTNGFTNNESKILFNFYEATTLNISRNFRGGIYAPRANVTQLGSNFDGSVVAASLSQNAEIHNQRFSGYLPYTPVPEPSAAVMAFAGLGLAFRRRR